MTKLVAIFHDEGLASWISRLSMTDIRERMVMVKAQIEADPTCGFGDEHTGPPNYTPSGPRCGNPATHFILWDDARWSLGCVEHLGPFDEPAPPSVIIPLSA